ncbi:MAG: HD domain-containing protein [bacterium]|nr:HD domain-containing protein [bacterium]
MNTKKIVNFIFEINQLKRRKQTGWSLAGVNNPPSIAEHSLRAAQIGYIVAVMENANAEKVSAMLVMHDNGEARIGDQNKIAARYFDKSQAESEAFSDQAKNLGEKIERKWREYFEEFKNRNTKEGIVAKDADWLETAFQAKEYLDLGHTSIEDWIQNVEKAVETKSAKVILEEMKKTKFTDWWKGLKKMTYKKLK